MNSSMIASRKFLEISLLGEQKADSGFGHNVGLFGNESSMQQMPGPTLKPFTRNGPRKP